MAKKQHSDVDEPGGKCKDIGISGHTVFSDWIPDEEHQWLVRVSVAISALPVFLTSRSFDQITAQFVCLHWAILIRAIEFRKCSVNATSPLWKGESIKTYPDTLELRFLQPIAYLCLAYCSPAAYHEIPSLCPFGAGDVYLCRSRGSDPYFLCHCNHDHAELGRCRCVKQLTRRRLCPVPVANN